MKKVSIVFYISVAILALLVLVGVTTPTKLENVTSSLQDSITNSFGWYYLIVVTLFVIVCLYLLVSPIGRIKLGKQKDKPEFSRPTWLAMLFSAGMGIGRLVSMVQLSQLFTMQLALQQEKLGQIKQ